MLDKNSNFQVYLKMMDPQVQCIMSGNTASYKWIWAFNIQPIPVLTFHSFKSQKKIYWYQAEFGVGRNIAYFTYADLIANNHKQKPPNEGILTQDSELTNTTLLWHMNKALNKYNLR